MLMFSLLDVILYSSQVRVLSCDSIAQMETLYSHGGVSRPTVLNNATLACFVLGFRVPF